MLDAQQQVRLDPLGAITRVVAPPTEHDTEDRGLAPARGQGVERIGQLVLTTAARLELVDQPEDLWPQHVAPDDGEV